MSALPSYFIDFLASIRLTDTQIEECKTGHTTLRERLDEDEDLRNIIVSTFLQGSYRRATAIKPCGDAKKSDVDVIVVTNLAKNKINPKAALEHFRPFLKKYYDGKYELQGRSWKIRLSYVEMDLVPTSAPSEELESLVKSFSITTNENILEAKNWVLSTKWEPGRQLASNTFSESEEKKWKSEPLWIPDHEAQVWKETHPLAQINATMNKNKACNGHFINVVKCIKWWKAAKQPKPKYPKSYPLEHLIWANCPIGIDSVAKGIVQALEAIKDNYQADANAKRTPFIPDHGVPSHNVMGRVSGDDFSAFHGLISTAAQQARKAFNEEDAGKSAILWRDLLGEKFPEPPTTQRDDASGDEGRTGGYTPRKDKSVVSGGRFA